MKLWISSILLFLLIITIVSAQQVSVQLNPIIDGENLTGSISIVTEYSSNENIISEQTITISANNQMVFSLNNNTNSLTVSVDESKTPGMDLFGKLNIQSSTINSEELIILPIGSLFLNIVDKNKRPVNTASIRIDCDKSYGEQGRFITDEFGVIQASNLPVGNCEIRAAYEDSFTSSSITIIQGTIIQEEIIFSDLKLNKSNFPITILVIVVIVAVILILVFRKKEAIKVDESEKKNNSKEDLFSVLSKKEVAVLEFLAGVAKTSSQETGKQETEVFVSQTQIVHEAGIPKTSLTRILNLLESKQLIIVERIGKSKRVYLGPKMINK